ncbi:MAG: FAD-dependent oxidoreductase [Oscillospiraceae bacterium]|nr:FAD-dependent oxidoreductase [Oscillospiraceae bacterium]
MSKVVLIGANHAGIAFTNTVLGNSKDTEVVIFERNPRVSYLGCGTALWVGQQIENNPDNLFYTSLEALEEKGARVYVETEVKHVDFAAKTVTAVGKDGAEMKESYDKLVLATGSRPVEPGIPGMGLENVHYLKTFREGEIVNALMDDPGVKRVAIVGAGYIGVEAAEAVRRRGRETMLFDVEMRCLTGYYDPWFTEGMDKVLRDNGIELHYGETVKAINGDGKVQSVVTDKGEYPCDLVIMAIGFTANSCLGEGVLELAPNGAYQVNLKQETSLPGVYAVGDCATVFSNALQDRAYIALATNAVRSGVVAALNVIGVPLESGGVQGSNGISIFGYNMVSTGLNLVEAKKAGFDPLFTDFEDLQKPGFVVGANAPVKIRIVYDKATRRVLGAQLASTYDISMGIHMFSLAVAKQVTIDELKLLDIFFLPHFNQPYNYITMAALSAE